MTARTSPLNMKAVTALTGLNESTLRAWERRYGAVEPLRTSAGQRRYSFDDVERLRLLVRLTELGLGIGDVATLPSGELAERLTRVESSARRSQGEGGAAARDGVTDASARSVGAIAEALRSFDLASVHELIDRARFRADPRAFVLETVAPLMAKTGDLVQTGDLSVAQEHALSAVIKSHLLAMIFAATRAKAPARVEDRVAIAAMEGDLHEIGLLIAGVLCAFHGRTVLYLGANMPAEPLASAVRALDAGTLLLGLTPLPPETLRQPVLDYVQRLSGLLPTRHQIWLGGPCDPGLRDDVRRSRCLLLPTFAALDLRLRASP